MLGLALEVSAIKQLCSTVRLTFIEKNQGRVARKLVDGCLRLSPFFLRLVDHWGGRGGGGGVERRCSCSILLLYSNVSSAAGECEVGGGRHTSSTTDVFPKYDRRCFRQNRTVLHCCNVLHTNRISFKTSPAEGKQQQ